MALCLKKLKNLSKVKLIDANFLWTEPHSKRIKVKLAIQLRRIKIKLAIQVRRRIHVYVSLSVHRFDYLNDQRPECMIG